jgi:hypothetical protein
VCGLSGHGGYLKLPVKLRPARGNRDRAVTVSLRPAIVHALGLKPGAPLAAILDRQVVIICPAEDAEKWETLLWEFTEDLAFLGLGSRGSAPPARFTVL